MWLIALLILICIISAGIVAFFARNAPMGYEDPQGFHYGEPPAKGQRPL